MYWASRAIVWNLLVVGVPDSLLLVAGEEETPLRSESSLRKRALVGVPDSAVDRP